jgi:steroid delta-isomerase-like uncharacterized protein
MKVDASLQIEKMLIAENFAWNKHDVNEIAKFYTDDCFKEDVAIGKSARGKEEMKALIAGGFASIPDMKIELLSVFSNGRWAATEWIMSGTYSNIYPGWSSATGKYFSIPGATIMELREGKINRISDYWNFASFQKQIGLVFP